LENEQLIEKKYKNNVFQFLVDSKVDISDLNKNLIDINLIIRNNNNLSAKFKDPVFQESLINELTFKEIFILPNFSNSDCMSIYIAQSNLCESNFNQSLISSCAYSTLGYGFDYFVSYMYPVFTAGSVISGFLPSVVEYFKCHYNADEFYQKCKKIKK